MAPGRLAEVGERERARHTHLCLYALLLGFGTILRSVLAVHLGAGRFRTKADRP